MKRNFKRFDKKLLFQYVLILISSLCIGFLLPRFLSEAFLQPLYQKISLHFQVPIYGAEKFSDWIKAIFEYALSDIICLCIVLTFLFSSITSVISGCAIAYIGIKSGCQLSLVYLTYISNIEYPPAYSEVCVFFILKILIVVFLMRYIFRCSLFSATVFYSPYPDNTFIWKALKFMGASLLYVCVLLFLHGIYCFTIKSI